MGGGGYSDEKLLPVETVHSYTFPCIGTATTSVGNGGYSSLEICDEGRNNHLEIDDEGRNSSLEISDEGTKNSLEISDKGRNSGLEISDKGRQQLRSSSLNQVNGTESVRVFETNASFL